MELRQSTEIKVRIGPFVDVTNGYEPETGITLGAADEAELLKHNGVATVDISGATWSAVAGCDGWYDLTLTTSHTDTLGCLTVIVQDDSVCLPVFPEFEVVNQQYWDSKYSTDKLQVDAVEISGDSTAADNLELITELARGVTINSTGGTAGKDADDLIDDICDEELTGAIHNVAGSLGRRIREVGAYAIHSGTAQAGANVSITLAAGASTIDGTYNRNLLVLTDNTGVGQTRTIIDYDGSTKIAIIDREWRTNPDATTEYQIVADDTPLVVDQGVAQAGSTSSTIKLRAYASSTTDIYLCNIVIIVAGTGRGQARLVGGYNGSTKVITLCGDDWTTTPDDTSVYVMIPYGATCTSCVGDDALAQINTECNTALTDSVGTAGDGLTAVPWNTAWDAEVQSECADALTAYDPPTRTEATADKDEILVDTTAIKTKTDNLPSGPAKNVAFPKFDFYMVLSSDHVSAAEGKTIVGEISKDGGSFATITNAITEVSDGMYTIADGFTQTEMNADVISLKFTETDCDPRIITIYTT